MACAAIVVLALVFWRDRPSGAPPVVDPAAPESSSAVSPYDRIPPVACRIAVLPGNGEQPALLTLRLFSARLRQAHLDRAAGGAVEQDPPAPIRLEMGREMWSRQVRCYLVDRQTGQKEDVSAALSLIKAPQDSSLLFGPDSVYVVHYALARQTHLPAAGAVQLSLSLPHGVVGSNLAEIPLPPSNEDEERFRAIAVAHRLGDHAVLLWLAAELTDLRPQAPEGYYFQGVALEGQGRQQEALVAYRQALKHLPLPHGEGFQEPPDLLFDGIRRMEQVLGHEGR